MIIIENNNFTSCTKIAHNVIELEGKIIELIKNASMKFNRHTTPYVDSPQLAIPTSEYSTCNSEFLSNYVPLP